MSYQIKTRKDYDFYECSSAFQKSIRRCKERDALFFGFELYASGYSKYAWKRMLLMASEDIGIADDGVAIKLNALYNNWKMIMDNGGSHGQEVIFIHAIMALSRAKKSRICDHAKIYAMITGENPEIPDYALDNHTRRGKQMGRGLDYFMEEGTVLENQLEIDDEYKNTFDGYLLDYQNKRCPDEGYDDRNVVHKSAKEMDKWKAEHAQQGMFDNHN